MDPDRITTLDGAGALASGDSALGRPAHNGADEYKFATYMYGMFDVASALRQSVEEARRRCTAGDPTEALLLGRDLHWASAGDPAREALANELLVTAYRALDRPSLAERRGILRSGCGCCPQELGCDDRRVTSASFVSPVRHQ